MAGDVGFDPVGFSSYWADVNELFVSNIILRKTETLFIFKKDWSQQVVPDIWPEAASRTPITTIEWMREAELKHGRLSMLAVVVLISIFQYILLL